MQEPLLEQQQDAAAGIVEDRNAAMRQLGEDLTGLREIMTELNVIAEQQGVKLDSAAGNAGNADGDTAAAASELRAAEGLARKLRRRIAVLVAIVLAIVAIVVIILVAKYAPKKHRDSDG